MLKMRYLYVLAAAAFVIAWFFLLRPPFLGGPASYIMVSGPSMEPTLSTGDLAVLRRQDTYHNGDIVAFPVQRGIVIHRIVGEAPEGFVTQGDNRDAPDGWRPTEKEIVGKMWFRVPGGGRFLALLRAPLNLGLLAGGLGMLTVLSGGSGKPASPSRGSPSRPAETARRDPPGTRLILGLVLAAALTGAVGLLRKKDKGRPG